MSHNKLLIALKLVRVAIAGGVAGDTFQQVGRYTV